MACLQCFQHKFVLDYDKLAKHNFIANMVKHKPQEFLFHLQCAIEAYNTDNSLRYLPNPITYVASTKSKISYFIDQIRDIVANFDQLDPNRNYVDIDCRYTEIDTYQRILYFTLFTCDLKLTLAANIVPYCEYFFMVECNREKECSFSYLPGPVSYLLHITSLDCLYSICRNGIKSMSNEPGFCTTGKQYGPGIYLQIGGHYLQRCPNVALCYAVKNAEAFNVHPNVYLVTEKDICLSSITVLEKGHTFNQYDCAIIREETRKFWTY